MHSEKGATQKNCDRKRECRTEKVQHERSPAWKSAIQTKQYEKSAIWLKCNMEEVQYEYSVIRKRNSAAWKQCKTKEEQCEKMLHEKSVVWSEGNTKKEQHENSAIWKKCVKRSKVQHEESAIQKK